MTTAAPKARPNAGILIFAGLCLIAPAVSIYQMLTQFADIPRPVAAAACIGLDLGLVLFGRQALECADDGDASWPWNAAMVAGALASVAAQVAHPLLLDRNPATGVLLGVLAVVGLSLFEGQLRRVHRVNARRESRLPMARSRVSLEQWWRFRRQARLATDYAILDPTLTAHDAFVSAVVAVEAADQKREQDIQEGQQKRRSLGLQIQLPGMPSGQPAIESGQRPDESGQDDGSVTPLTAPAGSVSELVKAAIEIHGPDDAAVIRTVRAQRPDANPDSVRRTLSRARKQKAAS